MELRQYGSVLMRRWPIWVGLTLIALVFSTVLALRGPVAYEATLRLAVGTVPLMTTDPQYDPNYYAWISSEYLADDLSELLRSEAFAQDVSEILGYRLNPEELAEVTRTQKTHRMLDLTVPGSSPQEALAIANAYEEAINTRLPSYFPQLQVQNAKVTMINRPKVARAMGAGEIVGTVLLRGLIGLALGVALVFLLEYLDSTIRNRTEAELMIGVPVLGEIPVLR